MFAYLIYSFAIQTCVEKKLQSKIAIFFEHLRYQLFFDSPSLSSSSSSYFSIFFIFLSSLLSHIDRWKLQREKKRKHTHHTCTSEMKRCEIDVNIEDNVISNDSMWCIDSTWNKCMFNGLIHNLTCNQTCARFTSGRNFFLFMYVFVLLSLACSIRSLIARVHYFFVDDLNETKNCIFLSFESNADVYEYECISLFFFSSYRFYSKFA